MRLELQEKIIPKKKWRIGVENPDETLTSNFNTVIELSDMSLATSGSYRNYYLDNNLMSHIIDPSTGFPQQQKLLFYCIA